MEILQYKENENLIENNRYIVDCGIEFTYSLENKEKPYLLNNGIRLDHIPTSKDIGTNNLKAYLTEEERKQLATKAGKASGIARAKKKTLAERLTMLAQLPLTDNEINGINPDILEAIPEEDRRNLTKEDLISIKMLELAAAGSKDHQVLYRDTIGEKPTDRQEVTANIMTEGDRLLIEKISARLQLSDK